MNKTRIGGMKIIVCLFFAAIVGAAIYVLTQTSFTSTAKIVPPKPVFNDCSAIENEINKYDWDKELAFAIAKAESECNVNAYGDEDLVYRENGRDYGYSMGAFQVRILPGREYCETYDVEKNVACAYEIYTEKGSFSPWSGYTTGKYKKYFWRTLEEL